MKKLTAALHQSRIEWALFCLRLGVFIVMAVWTLDKFINPAHTAKVFEGFYLISGLDDTAFYLIGATQTVLVLAFLAGYKKRLSYGAVFLMHGISTVSSWHAYLDMKLLFFAAWPMLAACFTLYLLRDLDVKFTIDK